MIVKKLKKWSAAIFAVVLALAVGACDDNAGGGGGTGTYTALQLGILVSDANAAKDSVVVDTASSNVQEEVFWVTQAALNALDAAIAAAEGAKGTKEIDDAYTALSDAIAAFNSAKQEGTILPDPVDYSTTLNWGTSFAPLTLGLTPGNDTTELNLNWYSTGSAAGKSAQVRFIRGTVNAGLRLLQGTGTVGDASSGYVCHKVKVAGLRPGSSYKYSVSEDGSNWSDIYDLKVPAAAGAWRFAAVGDVQLTTGQGDVNSRNTRENTAAGWLFTMTKIVAANVNFIASMGDQVDASGGNETEYTNFFAPPGLRNLPFAPTSGNHDNHLHFNYHYNIPNVQSFAEETVATAAGRNYFYLYNNILFVVLNTAPYPGSTTEAEPHVERFDDTLTAAKAKFAGKYDWLIVQHHKSTASVADHLADRDIQYYVEAGFEKVMSDHNVDFVMAGHDHVYARSYPLSGRDGGKVSVPDKSQPTQNTANASVTNPGAPIYITLTTGSGLKYYAVSSDDTFNYNNTLYVKDNAVYPYLGDVTDAEGTSSTYYGSTAYMTDKRMPVSNAWYVQPYIPSYTIVDVNGKTITFKTYTTHTLTGTSAGASAPYNFDATVPYDTLTVTK
ncbi:MAG: metallophosphoesterase family protein [Treponema sp.]|nr:metallophosphoesterase family protein [Treponema sp.]